MDEEMRAKLAAMEEGRAAIVEEYRQRAIATKTDLDCDLIDWFRESLQSGRLGNGGMAGEAVDLLWRVEDRSRRSHLG